MAFFSKKQKDMALNTPRAVLESQYKRSEENLQNVSKFGDDKLLKSAMKKHGDIEYAMLYTNTPQYRKELSKIKK